MDDHHRSPGGAPAFEQVNYWPELVSLIRRWKCQRLGLCWAGFALAYLAGVDKQPFERKLFRVYPMFPAPDIR